MLAAGFACSAEFRVTAEAPAVLYDAPSAKAKPLFVYGRDVPVEILVNVEGWTKVRDASGSIGWIGSKALADKRILLVRVPVAEIRANPDDAAPIVFRAEQNVLLELAETARRPPPRLRRDGSRYAIATASPALSACRRSSDSSGTRPMTTVAVLGAGAWGTAIACHLAARAASARRGAVGAGSRPGRHAAHSRENARYLPGVSCLRRSLVTADLAAAARTSLLLAAVRLPPFRRLRSDWPRPEARAAGVARQRVRARAALAAGFALAHQVLRRMWPAPVGIARARALPKRSRAGCLRR